MLLLQIFVTICTRISRKQFEIKLHIVDIIFPTPIGQTVHLCIQSPLSLSVCSPAMVTSVPNWQSEINFVLFFHPGVSFLEGKDDIFEDWREKFLNTYKVRGGPSRHDPQHLGALRSEM